MEQTEQKKDEINEEDEKSGNDKIIHTRNRVHTTCTRTNILKCKWKHFRSHTNKTPSP